MNEYWCAECDEWNVNCSCKASKIIKELEEKLAGAESKYFTLKHVNEMNIASTEKVMNREKALKDKLSIAIEALSEISDRVNFMSAGQIQTVSWVALKKIK